VHQESSQADDCGKRENCELSVPGHFYSGLAHNGLNGSPNF
jgi:hypothetical protein